MDKNKKQQDYVENYSIILIVLAFLIFFLGMYIWIHISLLMALICWGVGFLYILFVNILKDILQELRKNSIKQ